MKILITGNLGFIFSHVTEYFLSQGHEVWGIDALYDGSNPKMENELRGRYPDTYRQFKFDIINMTSGFKAIPPMVTKADPEMILHDSSIEEPIFDIIIHAAAESNVDKSIEGNGKVAFMRSNIQGTYAMLEYAIKKQPRVFLYINTDEVYGSVAHPSTESTAPNPGNPYSASKQAAANLCYAYRNTYGLNVKEVRMCNIIGPRQATTKLIPRVVECLRKGYSIPVYDGGKARREYMDVRDVGPILDKVLESNELINNLTSNQSFSILEVITIISQIMEKEPILEPSTRLGHDMNYQMIPSPVCEDFSFTPFVNSIINIIEHANR